MMRCIKNSARAAKRLLVFEECAKEDAEPSSSLSSLSSSSSLSVFDGRHRVADLCALVLEQLKDSSGISSSSDDDESDKKSWFKAAQQKPLLHQAAREPTASRRRKVARYFEEHPRAGLVVDRLDATSYLAFADLEMHLVREISVGLFDIDTDLVHLLALLRQATLFRVQKRYRFKARERSAPRGFELTDKPQGKTLLVKRNVWTDEKGVGYSSDFKNLGRFAQQQQRHNSGGTDARQRTAFKLVKKTTRSGLEDDLGRGNGSSTNPEFTKAQHGSKASKLLKVRGSEAAAFMKNRTKNAANCQSDILEDVTAFNEARRDSQQQADRDRADRLRDYRRYVVQKIQRGLCTKTALPVDQVLAMLPEIEARVRKTIQAVPDSGKQQTSAAEDVYAFAKRKVRELLCDVAANP